jgi:hypothetical protein
MPFERVGLGVMLAVFLFASAGIPREKLAVCNRFDVTGPWHRREHDLLALTALSLTGVGLHLKHLWHSLRSRPLAIALVLGFSACVAEINFNKNDYIETVNACDASLAHTVTAAVLVVFMATICAIALPAEAMVAQLGLLTVSAAWFVGDVSASRWPLANWCAALLLVLPLAFTLNR